jgi:hypothetical protein
MAPRMPIAHRRVSAVLVARRVAPRESQPRHLAARRFGPGADAGAALIGDA